MLASPGSRYIAISEDGALARALALETARLRLPPVWDVVGPLRGVVPLRVATAPLQEGATASVGSTKRGTMQLSVEDFTQVRFNSLPGAGLVHRRVEDAGRVGAEDRLLLVMVQVPRFVRRCESEGEKRAALSQGLTGLSRLHGDGVEYDAANRLLSEARQDLSGPVDADLRRLSCSDVRRCLASCSLSFSPNVSISFEGLYVIRCSYRGEIMPVAGVVDVTAHVCTSAGFRLHPESPPVPPTSASSVSLPAVASLAEMQRFARSRLRFVTMNVEASAPASYVPRWDAGDPMSVETSRRDRLARLGVSARSIPDADTTALPPYTFLVPLLARPVPLPVAMERIAGTSIAPPWLARVSFRAAMAWAVWPRSEPRDGMVEARARSATTQALQLTRFRVPSLQAAPELRSMLGVNRHLLRWWPLERPVSLAAAERLAAGIWAGDLAWIPPQSVADLPAPQTPERDSAASLFLLWAPPPAPAAQAHSDVRLVHEAVREEGGAGSSSLLFRKPSTASASSAATEDAVVLDGDEDEDDADVEMHDRCVVPLLDPLARCPIAVPVRGVHCSHLSWFDLFSFLDYSMPMLNVSVAGSVPGRQFRWKCPICQTMVGPGDLRVDPLPLAILERARRTGEATGTVDDVLAEYEPTLLYAHLPPDAGPDALASAPEPMQVRAEHPGRVLVGALHGPCLLRGAKLLLARGATREAPEEAAAPRDQAILAVPSAIEFFADGRYVILVEDTGAEHAGAKRPREESAAVFGRAHEDHTLSPSRDDDSNAEPDPLRRLLARKDQPQVQYVRNTDPIIVVDDTDSDSELSLPQPLDHEQHAAAGSDAGGSETRARPPE